MLRIQLHNPQMSIVINAFHLIRDKKTCSDEIGQEVLTIDSP
jgi:hypothetical protein